MVFWGNGAWQGHFWEYASLLPHAQKKSENYTRNREKKENNKNISKMY